MKAAADLIVKYCNKALNNRIDALIYVSVFALLPFTAWLAVALVALITLRKGKEPGLQILLPAMVAYLVSLVTITFAGTAVINALITFIPAFIAALVLRAMANWSCVFAALLLQACLGVIMIQCLAPDAVLIQYGRFLSLMSETPLVDQSTEIRHWLASWDQLQLAHIFFGIQILIIAGSAVVSLLFARFIQSKLFMSGGLKSEIRAFRSGKLALLVFIVLALLAYLKVFIAVDLLPLMLFYFLLSGLNLSFTILAHKKMLAIILCLVSLLVNPFTLLMACSFFGILDSIFNFRKNFFATARKSI